MQSPWKKDFPALNNNDIFYLDSAATCQVPQQVISSIKDYLIGGQGNAGRGLHSLSESASKVLDNCRTKVAHLIHCDQQQIIFTKGTTESINYVAASYRETLTKNDSILVTEMEHHSNLLPWQRLCQQTGAKLNVLPMDQYGNLQLEQLDELLQQNCQLFAFTHCSNVLGQTIDVQDLIQRANQYQVKTLIDGAQFISHGQVNLSQLNCDYYAFSGHKLYSTGGSGVLYCKNTQTLSPLLLGGGSVSKATINSYQLLENHARFEAGSANLVSLVALSSAIDYCQNIGFDKIKNHEEKLYQYLYQQLKTLANCKIVSHQQSNSLICFNLESNIDGENIHCHDVSSILADHKIATRAGHHCAQPCLNAIGIKHCLRVSLGLYNDQTDIDQLMLGLKKVNQLFLD